MQQNTVNYHFTFAEIMSMVCVYVCMCVHVCASVCEYVYEHIFSVLSGTVVGRILPPTQNIHVLIPSPMNMLCYVTNRNLGERVKVDSQLSVRSRDYPGLSLSV